jgi:hypothetical protein
MDLRQTNKMVDEWMNHYDELQRDLQREKQKVVSMKMEMGNRGIELDPLQQMRELRGQLRAENGQAADHKPTLARQAVERLAREDGNGDSPKEAKEKKQEGPEQTRKPPREKAKGMEVSL